MTEFEHKHRVGRFIFFSTLLLFALIIIFYFLKGFKPDEFTQIIKLLAPIKAVYMTALIKHVLANRNVIDDKAKTESKKVNKLYRSVTSFMIYAHIGSLIVTVSLFALFNLMDFESLKDTLVFLEIFFGAYVGLIMSDMFQTKSNEG